MIEKRVQKRNLMIAGGGTGGHVFAGIAVADAWKNQVGTHGSIVFVGAEGRIEERLVPRAGYPLRVLKLGSLKRVSLARRLKTFYQLPIALLNSAAYILKFRPEAVLGVGGFASGPLVLMARILRFFRLSRTQTAILEQNSVPGFTNKILGRWVDRVYCAFPGTEKEFPNKSVLVTGNPVRSMMSQFAPAQRDPFTIFIFGGSQGALGINTVVLEALSQLEDLKPQLRFIHQTGEIDYARVLEGHRKAGTQARVEKFVHEMAAAYAESSLLICRAGSSTLAEIAAVGRAAILVPLPTAADGHQEKNARFFSDAGAAFLLLQNPGAGAALAELIRKALAAPELIAAMERKATSFYRPRAAQDIVENLLNA